MDPVTSAVTGGGSSTYPDSVESSPRSRSGESWDEPSKLRLMCSYGGRIVPRPTDRSLCYLGGDTRIVVLDRTASLSDLSAKLSRTLLPAGNAPSFSLKYQLPNEDLDSLISLSTDEDLDNMIDEYDRIAAAAAPPTSNPSKRLRLFLFPSKPDSAPSSVGSLLHDSKSDTWFVDALNGAIGVGIDGLPDGLSADPASLLSLEDDSLVGAGGVQPDPDRRVAIPRPDSSGRLTRQDVHSVPDSPMMETMSSFGSTSSAQALSNLPPVRLQQDDRSSDPRHANIDEQFAQMNLPSSAAVAQRQEDDQKGPAAAPQMQQPMPLPNASALTPPDNSRNAVFGTEGDKLDDAGKPPLLAVPIQKPVLVEAPMSERPVYYYQEHMSMAAVSGNQIPELRREIPVSDPTYRMQPMAESRYAIPATLGPGQMHQFQQQQQPQQQFIQPNPQYAQVPTYYQVPHPMQQPQQFDQQMPMYYLPVRQNPQPPLAAAVPLPRMPPKTETANNIYRMAAPPAHMVQVAAGMPADQGQFYNTMGYHVMQHHHPSQVAPMVNFGYEHANEVAANSSTEPVQQEMYYTQATSPPGMQVQYQTVPADEVKQNRGP